jgi:hypothetical protein
MSRTLEFTVNYDLFKDQNREFYDAPVYEDDNVIVKANGTKYQSYDRRTTYYLWLNSFVIRYKALSPDANPTEPYTILTMDADTPVTLVKGANGDIKRNNRLGLSDNANATANVKFVYNIAPNNSGFIVVQEVSFDNIQYIERRGLDNTRGMKTYWRSTLWKPRKKSWDKTGGTRKKRQTKKRMRTYKN